MAVVSFVTSSVLGGVFFFVIYRIWADFNCFHVLFERAVLLK